MSLETVPKVAVCLLALTGVTAHSQVPIDPFEQAAKAEKVEQQVSGFLQPNQVEALTERIRPSVVAVRQIGRNGDRRGIGAGFVIDGKKGLIATNLHVIGEARPVQVEFPDGEVFPVKTIHSWDRDYDLAVLKIDPGERNLKALKLGDSSTLKQGNVILSFGSPLGLKFSVVSGVISAIRKLEPEFMEKTPEYPMIQVAMPVELGNSGGPIVNLKGEVVGIVTLRHRLKENLGFAVQSNDLKPLLEKPNSVPMSRWQRIGALDESQWRVVMDGDWSQRAGVIQAKNMGSGFGGRTLCLFQPNLPEGPYEVAVKVRLDDEGGAAGLAFAADGGDRHYGFYPSNGNLRLTRFDGPDVYSWDILEQLPSDSYLPGDWNRLRIRVDGPTITGFVNGKEVLSLEDEGLRGGKVGLCKFRKTEAEFREFRIGDNLQTTALSLETQADLNQQLDQFLEDRDEFAIVDQLAKVESGVSKRLLENRARELEQLAEELRSLKTKVHLKEIADNLKSELSRPEVDLFEVALQLARIDDLDLDVVHYRNQMNRLVADAKTYLGDAKDEAAISKLTDFLFKENGFHGSRSDYYYDHSNSYIHHVIDDREGLPITLSILYMEMARRLGIKQVFGVALPGQFQVGYLPNGGEKKNLIVINVFEGGKQMTRREAEMLALQFRARTTSETFKPSPPEAIAGRMLRNLIGLEIDQEQNPPGALNYLNILVDLEPEDGFSRFQRALVQVQMKHYHEAKLDLDWLLENRPPGIDYRRLKQFRSTLPD